METRQQDHSSNEVHSRSRIALRFLRTPKILEYRDISRATYYNEVEEGLMPNPVKAGGRQAGIFEHELEQIMSAYARGEDKKAIKVLVKEIEAARKVCGLEAA